jgi:hypothetical protein
MAPRRMKPDTSRIRSLPSEFPFTHMASANATTNASTADAGVKYFNMSIERFPSLLLDLVDQFKLISSFFFDPMLLNTCAG